MKKFLVILILMLLTTTAVFAFSPSEVKEPAQPTKPASGASSETSSCHIGYGKNGGWKEKDITFYKPADGRIYLKTASEIYSSALSNTSRNTAYSNTTKIVLGFPTPDSFDEESPDKNGPFLIGYADTENAYCPIIFHDGTLYFLVADSDQTIYFNSDSSTFLSDFEKLTTVEVGGSINVSLVENLNGFASGTKINKDSVSVIAGMFSNAPVLQSVSGMFKGLTTISSANLSSMDLSHVYDASEMFSGCSNLTSVTLPSGDKALHSACTEVQDQARANATTSQMASGADVECLSLINNSNRYIGDYQVIGETGKAAIGFSMARMFNGCSSLSEIDLSNVNINGYTDIAGAFYNCSSLGQVFVSNTYSDSSLPVAVQYARLTGTVSEYYKLYNYVLDSQVFTGCNNLKGYFLDASGEREELVAFSTVTDTDKASSTYAKSAHAGGYFTVKGAKVYKNASLDFADVIQVNLDLGFNNMTVPSISMSYPDYTDNSKSVNDTNPTPGTASVSVDKRYSAKIAAAQMTRPITFVFGSDSYVTSVRDLAEEYISRADASTEKDAALVDLMEALLNYGAYAQLYFDFETSYLANKNHSTALVTEVGSGKVDFTEMTTSPAYVFDGSSVSSVTEAQTLTAGENFKARFLGNSVVCYAEVCVRHSFAFADGVDWDDFTVSVSTSEGVSTPTVKTGSLVSGGVTRYYVEISGLASANIDTTYTVTITNNDTNKSFSITYSTMSYIKGVLTTNDETKAPQALKNLCASIYWYNKYAKAYFKIATNN